MCMNVADQLTAGLGRLVGWLNRSMYAGYISRPHKGEAPGLATRKKSGPQELGLNSPQNHSRDTTQNRRHGISP